MRRGGAAPFALLCVLVLCASCAEGERGALHTCTCNYLTDTDLAGHKQTVVCAADGAAAVAIAKRCVSGEGVGTVEACACDAAREACTSAGCAE